MAILALTFVTPSVSATNALVDRAARPAAVTEAEAALAYVSDYVSFVGQDGEGHVAFALDTNRGRDGDAYQAEHFVVLHDERRGWVPVAGTGTYEPAASPLHSLPNSPAFTFRGTPRDGLVIHSAPNTLTLDIQPIVPALAREHGGGRYRMGVAAATLTWGGRRLPGRVIYEYLYVPGFNRLTRTYWGLWDEFQALYLSIGRTGDLYVHRQQRGRLLPLVGALTGFGAVDGRVLALQDLSLTPRSRTLALGFFRWPSSWELGWTGAAGSQGTTLTLMDRKTFGNWVIGGFSMGIVKGEISLEGRLEPVYGFAELLM